MAESAAVVKTKMKREGLALVTPLEERVKALEIKTAEDYLEADEILTSVRQARAKWEAKYYTSILVPMRKALDAGYALNREVDGPLEAMEKAVKLEMKDYKLLEAKQQREADEARARETARLQQAAAVKQAAEDNAKTTAMRNKLRAAREKLEEEAAEVEETAPIAAPVKASGSVGRKVKKWRVLDIGSVIHHWEEFPDETILLINPTVVNAAFKKDPDVVAKWPGFEVFDDIEIAGR